MATTKKASKKTSSKKATKKETIEVIPELYEEFPLGETGAEVLSMSLYEREGKPDNLKFVVADTIVVYAKAIVMDDYAFVSWPNFKAGDKFINQAFCIDKEILEKINDTLTAYYFDD